MKKPGRPRTYGARQALFVRLDPALHARIVAEAERRDVSANQLAEWALERMLPLWETQDPDEFTRAEPTTSKETVI